ncbi:retrovirus-related pol polyprotein from transposon TNT 1-94 [Tanacetum coccineum]
MDVKSAFLYGKIEEEVYVCQPSGFEDPDFPDRVYNVEKALYGLHQAPRAWYETLSTYLFDNGFQRGKIDKTLFIKRHKGDILLMSSMRELTFFLGLQVKQKKDGIFISQDKYVAKILKKFGFTEVKTASTPILDIMFAVCACARYQVNPKVSHLYDVKRIFRYLKGQPKLGLWYPKDSPFDLVAYTNSDYARASLDRKSTTGEAEYVAASSCCGQVLWIQNQLLNYGYNFMHTKDKQKKSVRLMMDMLFGMELELMLVTYYSWLKVNAARHNLCLSPKTTAWNEFSSTMASAIICLATNQKFNFSKLIFDSMVRNLDNLSDEAVYKERGDSLVRDASTASCLEAEQDSGNITKTRSKATLNEPSSPRTSSGSSLRCQETMGIQLLRLVAEVIKIAQVSTASEKVSSASATTTTEDDLTLAQALADLKSTKPKAKRIAFREPAEIDEEERITRAGEEKINEANISWDNIQAKVDANYQLAERLQAEEQEQFTIEEKATLFKELLEQIRKHFNMEGWKYKDLKSKDFDSIKELFDRALKRVNTFVDFRTDLVEGSSKRAGEELEQESTKKQKVDEDKDIVELQRLMEVIPNEEDVTIDAIPLAVKSLRIVNWKIHKEGKKSYYQIIIVTAALIDVNAAQSKLVLLENFNENYSECLRLLYKVNAAEGVNAASEEVSTAELVSTAYVESGRQISDKGDLSAYWREISSEGDFLGTPPSYTLIRDPMLRLYHRLIACSIAGRSQASEKETPGDLTTRDCLSPKVKVFLIPVIGSLLIKAYSHRRDLQSELLIERYKFLKSAAEKLKLCCSSWMVLHGIRYYCWLVLHTVLMVDSIPFGQEMVNILVSGEAYDKVFNHLDMLHAPLEGKVDATAHDRGTMSYLTDYEEIDEVYIALEETPKKGKSQENVPLKLGNLVRGLPSKLFENDQTCVACQKGKQHRASCKSKTENSISLPLHLLHMDLFGPTFVKSLMKKMYCLVVIDDYSRFTWVFFLATKDETSGILKSFITGIENLVDHKVKVIRCDNGTEFKNREMNQFCEMKGILRQFSVARTPQQNGVAERRNRILIEAARTMLADSKLPTTFWAEAVNTACYVQNRVLVVKPHNKTLYELFHGRTPTLSFMRPFGCHVTILNTIDHLGKFDGKADEGFFVRYSLNSKAFRVFNSRTRIVEENLHIRFSKSTPNVVGSGPDWLFDIDALTRTVNYEPIVSGTQSNGFAGTKASDNADPKSSLDNEFKPLSDDGKKVDEDLRKESECKDQDKEDNVNSTNTVNVAGTNEVNAVDNGVVADINNLDTTIQVSPIPTTRIHKDHPLDQVIGDLQSATQTRKVSKNLKEHRNKKDERGIMIRNKARLVAQGYTQEEGIDYDEVFTPVARIEAIRLFLAYASFKDFVVYQMDVKSDFLYEKIEEEVYVCQPPGFKDPDFPDRVYKVEKALYGLHQAPRSLYETLSTYLLDNGFQRGKIDKTLFIKRHKGDILLVQVYVNDIIFGSTNKKLCNAFEKLMHEKFQISSMGELTFFLGLQVQQKKDGIFISQDKYVVEILKKFGFK